MVVCGHVVARNRRRPARTQLQANHTYARGDLGLAASIRARVYCACVIAMGIALAGSGCFPRPDAAFPHSRARTHRAPCHFGCACGRHLAHRTGRSWACSHRRSNPGTVTVLDGVGQHECGAARLSLALICVVASWLGSVGIHVIPVLVPDLPTRFASPVPAVLEEACILREVGLG
jgi:hypothetical protein